MKLSYRSRLRRSPRGGGMEKKALRAFFSIPPPTRRSSPHGIDAVAQKIPFAPSSPYLLPRAAPPRTGLMLSRRRCPAPSSPYPLSRAAPPRTGLMLSRRRSPSRLLLHTSSHAPLLPARD